MAENIQEVSLHIDGQVFKVKKDVLCEHSDYFRAMFSGNFNEDQKQDITIDVVDANSMEIILKYFNIGLIDLSEYTLPVVGSLAMAVNFLQITELIKQIQFCLDLRLSTSNWVEIMEIAVAATYTDLEQLAGTYGLLAFKDMKTQYIPTVNKLFWYLSHPSLNTETEADVFRFGMQWLQDSNTYCCEDILLIILSCLDVKKLTIQDIKEISILIKDYEDSKAAKVVDCIKMLLDNKLQVHISVLAWYQKDLCETYSESLYNDVYNIINESTTRLLNFTTVLPMWTLNDGQLAVATHYLYSYTRYCGFSKWLEVADKNLWGWNITAWGPNKLVVVGGEHGRGTGRFVKDVRIYDSLRRQWTHHGADLPGRRHTGVTVCGDSLFIIGGVGGFRVLQGLAIIYDLKYRTHRKIADFPDAIQSPAICSYYGTVYAAGHKDIYKYEDLGEDDQWIHVMTTSIRPNHLVSFGDYIYCTQNYFSPMYRFRPGIDTKLQMVTEFSAPPVAFANLGDTLVVVTKALGAEKPEQFRVEEYRGPCNCSAEKECNRGNRNCGPDLTVHHTTPDITINDVSGACALVMDLPTMYHQKSEYHQKLIAPYGNITYE